MASTKNAIRLLVMLGIVGGGAAYQVMHKPISNPATSLRTATIQRGDLLSTITATGTVEAEEVVNVAQVAGLIVGFGDDPHIPPSTLTIAASSKRIRSWRKLIPPSTSQHSSRPKRHCKTRKPICCSLKPDSGRRSENGSGRRLCYPRSNCRHRL